MTAALCTRCDRHAAPTEMASPTKHTNALARARVGTLCFVALPLGCDEATKAAFSAAFKAAYEDAGVKEQLHNINMDMNPCVTGDDAAAAVVENYNLYHSLAADFGLLAPGR